MIHLTKPFKNYDIFIGIIFLKFIIFDIIWCSRTTFAAFSFPELYLNAALVTYLFTLPFSVWRKRRTQIIILFILDLLLIANLMYSRTYNDVIPLKSYILAGNLEDFVPSVVDSVRWYDIIFPLSSLATIWFITKKKEVEEQHSIKRYLLVTSTLIFLSLTLNWSKGGFSKAYESLQNANYHTCDTPAYTLFGDLWYDALKGQEIFTPAHRQLIENWLSERPTYQAIPDSITSPRGLVLILCESLESWVLEKEVEGIEMTPHLNQAIRDSRTLYAPHVLTQVRGGRSIDCQLLLNAGMLPLENGCYSMQFPHHTYFTLTKALKERHHANSYLMTVDKPIVWNQAIVAEDFGIENTFYKSTWKLDEKIGSRKRLGDESFMRQLVEKLKEQELCKIGEPFFLQCVTYSGHNPFILPEESKKIHLKGNYPTKLKDYLTMANYTDHAIGQLLDYLKTRPDYTDMMIVIVGDHEGLAADREPILSTPIGRKLVSPNQFTPFIVLNAPIAIRYEGVMGQIDMYPTILNLMHLDDYIWKGMGQSILDPNKVPFAVDPQERAHTFDQIRIPDSDLQRLQKAYKVSDLMLRFDYNKKYLESFDK